MYNINYFMLYVNINLYIENNINNSFGLSYIQSKKYGMCVPSVCNVSFIYNKIIDNSI